MPKKILVTGGAGFIGSALVRRLIADGHAVLVADKLTYAGNLASLSELARHERFRFERADIADRPAMAALLSQFRPEIVFNLAAESHVDRSIDAPAAFIGTNVAGTHVLLEACLDHWRGLDAAARGAFRFLQVSTDEVFGSLGPEGRFDETSPYRPSSPYAASKAAGDHLARAWHRTYGLPAIVSNGSNSFGPFQFPEKLIPVVIINALERTEIPVYGDGSNRRDWLFVDDHVRALLAIADHGVPGEAYCVGGGAELPNIEVVRAVCAELDRLRPDPAGPHARLVAFVADRPGHDFRYAVNPAKVAAFGWRPETAFAEGIRRTVAWYAGNAPWWRPIRDR